MSEEIKWNYGKYEYENFPCLAAVRLENEKNIVVPAIVQNNVAYDRVNEDILENVYAWAHYPDAPSSENEIEGVNHPSHYNRDGAMECIDEMILLFGKKETAIFCKLNAHKYRYRAGEKSGESGVKDLQKSDWYIAKYKELMENTNPTISTTYIAPGYSIETNFDKKQD